MAVEITLPQLLELTSPEDREAIFHAYQNGGFHYLGIYGDATGAWSAFGVGPNEECRTVADMDRHAPRSTVVSFYVPCPMCPTGGRHSNVDTFSYFSRWARELVQKEAKIYEESQRPQMDLSLVQERAQLEVKEKKIKDMEAKLADREKRFEETRKEYESKAAQLKQIEDDFKKREEAVIAKEREVERLEKRILELRAEEKDMEGKMKKLRALQEELADRERGLNEREEYIMQSEERMMSLTMEQQEREARLEQMLEDYNKAKARG